MLAGLIFATEDAEDRAGTLAETLPFGGLTLIEFQARLLIAAGATQIVLAVARMTPGLLGAISRIGRRGVTVDAVRTAAEAVETLHPLARVAVVADGVVTTGDTVALLAAERGDTLLVADDGDDRFERIGVSTAWAGLALIEVARIKDVAAMPHDYDFQSTLLRIVAQSGARQIRLPKSAESTHGIERDSQALARWGNAIVATLMARPVRWADRYATALPARLSLPPLLARGAPSWAFSLGAAVAGLGGLAAILSGWLAIGLVVLLAAMLLATIGHTLAWLRDEALPARLLAVAAPVMAAASLLAVGGATHSALGWALALGAVIAGGLVERIALAAWPHRWWSSLTAAPIVMLPFALFGYPLVALGAAGLYATATLAAAIETLIEKP
ncbi:hypothetical protein PX554_12635 [Sphingomonas sp. H39-1-10]|uniref:hypothetical protein n=1 Tax=Sphingomonas pollutisoli TaxID=3030829 RepID=UPI0023B95074|nr:hypothetical protein [Sphingomonas pollutisoli]MDF0488982.1 hypothetical protein [Sphingomonas pollutisoli]